jgi:hypothetical protein
MPPTQLVFFQDRKGHAPVVKWLGELRRKDQRGYAKIKRLAEAGHELRRPDADYLRDGVYELRARQGKAHHRILYCFQGRNVAVLAHALTKEGKVPDVDITGL